jgi:hypothetical protein
VKYIAVKNEYIVSIRETATKAVRSETEKYVLYCGIEGFPFELLISKNGKKEDLDFTKNLVIFDADVQNDEYRTDREGISVVQFENQKMKKEELRFVICEDLKRI